MSAIFFSIIIPTFNRAHIIKRAIDSVLNQSFKDFELIVVDDGSTDNTNVLIETKYHTVCKYIIQANAGVCSARNKGALEAKGEYLIFLDSDDWLSEASLQTFYKAIQVSNADLIHSQLKMLLSGGQEIIKDPRDPYSTGHPSNLGVQLPGSFSIKKNVFNESGGYDKKISYGENTELFWRLKKFTKTIYIIDNITVIMNRVEIDRSSKIPTNLINSLEHILGKHRAFLNENTHVKWLYLNNLGVAYLRMGNKKKGMICFVQAIFTKPFRWKSYARLTGSVLHILNYK